MCDLILLSWNHLEETRPCLESLFETTRVPVRLILVDNASEPEVRAYLKAVRPRGPVKEVVLLQNETNEGFPKGMNRGLGVSSAPFVCLLNNDLKFTDGWLEEMVEVASARPEIGVVNPASSTLGSRPSHGVSAQRHAEGLRPLRGRYTEVGACIGFCLLIKRAVLDRIGGLAEEVDRFFFEDEDFCARAQQAGFLCVVAEGAYVFHAEHVSVREVPEREALFRKNRRWCEEKWGRWVRIAWPQFAPPAPGSSELRRWLERLRAWARRRTIISVYCPMPRDGSGTALFESVSLIPHADIHWHAAPRRTAPITAAARILARQKKPFDLIASPDPGWGRLMARLQWLHHADVIPAEDEEQLTVLWQRRSRFPSSS